MTPLWKEEEQSLEVGRKSVRLGRFSGVSQSMQLIRTFMTVGGYTFLYRVSGIVRDTIQAAVLGAGPVADAFVVAFKLANVLRKLFAEGSFNAAFLPRFSAVLSKQGHVAAERIASQVLTWLSFVLVLLLIICIVFFPAIIRGYAPGFIPGSERFIYAVELGRICFPYIATSFIVALFSSVLNTVNRFATPAGAQLILNIFLVIAMLLGACGFPTIAHTMAVATFIAGIAQMVLLWSTTRYNGFKIGFTSDLKSQETKEIFRKIIPGAVGAGIWQLNLMIGVITASSLQSGAVSCFYYADHVNQFPLGILGIGLSTALLPPLSRAIQKNDFKNACGQFNLGVIFALVLTVPATALFLAIPTPIVSIFYEHGKFGHAEVCATAPTLAAFAVGLPAYMLAKVFSTALFAQGNTRHPCFAGLLSVVACVVTIPLFIPTMRQAGIALAISFSAWVNVFALYMFLLRHKTLFVFTDTWKACFTLAFSGIAMGLSIYGAHYALRNFYPESAWLRVAYSIGLGGGGSFIFWISGRLLGGFSLMHTLMADGKEPIPREKLKHSLKG
ncbi:MAG: murein biosynthesis integral membrane protein MurJ [Holosporales bacterium]|jgi:putative peptidoglycan lipid II flippase|nr:murein biosynthesis integral membrane protein MurJ [Holosporales bacterium]